MGPRTVGIAKGVSDLLVITCAFFAALFVRFEFRLPGVIENRLLIWVPLVVGVTFTAHVLSRAYRHPWRLTGLVDVIAIGRAMLASGLVLIGIWYLAPDFRAVNDTLRMSVMPRSAILLHVVFASIGLVGLRMARRLWIEHRESASLRRPGIKPHRVLLIGAGRAGFRVSEELKARPDLGLVPIGFLDDDPHKRGNFVNGLPVLGTTADLERVRATYRPDEAMVTIASATDAVREELRAQCKAVDLPVRDVPALFEVVTGEVRIVDSGALERNHELHPPNVPVRKRAMDVVVGGTLAIAAAPIIVVLALASAVTFRAWPFFIQDRVGLGGEQFRFPKIRSLPTDTPSYALKDHIDELDLPWLSRFIRDHHLDELPQLYLVPFGRMSLVGPRPKMPDDHEPVEERYAALRTLVPQGCTCLWQVGMDTHALPSDSPQYDFWYLTHGSIRLDTWILWRTGLTVMGVGGPVSLADVPGWARGRGWITEDLIPATTPEQSGVPHGDAAGGDLTVTDLAEDGDREVSPTSS